MGGERLPDGPTGPGATPDTEARIGLRALVSYQWQLAVGETPLTMEDFERLAAMRAPLVFIDGRWVEIRREDLDHAVRFIRENPGGEMRVGEALRMAYTSDLRATGIPILGIDAQGWVADLLRTEEEGGGGFAMVEPPGGFKGDLRPYQLKGLSWLTFLDRLGLGPCLADDMGLGKTIQLLALLLHEREHELAAGERVNPTLIVVPMSIVGNWVREAKRFAPELRVLVHHGVERHSGDSFFAEAARTDIVITTYALAHRDRELLQCVRWGRVVLDEAQNIKNASAKQSQAVRSLDAERRVALTGTPLENRLSELWSILDFCNPGLLGSSGEFRRSFSVPIERYHDKQRAGQLRKLVRPFILRRLKTDPTVISDLPEKVETKEYCRLTAEQAELYESCVKTMLEEVDHSEGIRRRGIVLTTLVRLKQVCNHPALLLKEGIGNGNGKSKTAGGSVMVSATRSGKCIRMLEMLDEVVAAGDQALVFTQFRQMGHLLASLLRQTLDREVLFLHGGTPSAQREAMIDRFQKADGSTPIFVLSLKAGGVGLNLTAASHVFHFDRWWNPAVENQATDRAFRIGQKRTVNVHKFVVSGTLEERIDQMIESKIALAEDVIGSGEDWLTELSTQQLRDVLALRREDALTD
jgi:SNF2 family DNA or RNA helicase